MNRLKKKHKKEAGWKKLVVWFLGLTLLTLSSVWVVRGVKLSQWKGQSWFGIVEQEQSFEVKLVSLEQKKLVRLIIPLETMVRVGFGFGEYRLGKVAQLGELEKKPGLILTKTVQDLLGLPITGWKINKKSNLTWWDRVRLAWFEKFIAEEKEVIDLGDSLAWQEGFLGDQTKIFRVNTSFLDQVLHEQVFNQKLAEEGLSVAILNASGIDGVANNVSRLVSNLGVEVRLVSNAPQQEFSIIKVSESKLKPSMTVKNISQFLGINSIEVIDILEYRSDVVIVIGQDYTKL